MTQPSGVVFPRSGPAGEQDRRSTSDLGRHVIADALRPVDVAGAGRVLTESDWRHAYPKHFRHVLQAGLGAPADALAIASAGLATLHRRMQWADPSRRDAGEGRERPLVGRPLRALHPYGQVVVAGRGQPERTVSLPYRGGRLEEDELRRRLADWVARGVMEPDAEQAVRRVMDHPEWLGLPGRTAVVLGAGAEMGPLRSLLRWGADVAAVDLPRPALWLRLLRMPASGPGASSCRCPSPSRDQSRDRSMDRSRGRSWRQGPGPAAVWPPTWRASRSRISRSGRVSICSTTCPRSRRGSPT